MDKYEALITQIANAQAEAKLARIEVGALRNIVEALLISPKSRPATDLVRLKQAAEIIGLRSTLERETDIAESTKLQFQKMSLPLESGLDPLQLIALHIGLLAGAGKQSQAMQTFLGFATTEEIGEEVSKLFPSVESLGGKSTVVDPDADGNAPRPRRRKRKPK